MVGERGTDWIGFGHLLAACLLLSAGQSAVAAVEATPWGPFEFPAPVRSQREAVAMYAEARAPIVIAIRFLAAAPTETPWINHHLACGTTGAVREDLGPAMVRASTLLAHRLSTELEQGRLAAAELRSGRTPASTVRYAGPVAVVLEPVTISTDGEPLSPPATVEPHLRVFVAASVPRCTTDATGAFGRVGELAGGFLITAAPALELGWPSWSPAVLGQRAVMGTDNLLADGFCCGEETAFGLDSLVNVFDYRDYQRKSRLRSTLKALGMERQRNAAWSSRVRDAFGIPERFADQQIRELRYGSGRIAPGEFTIWPAGTGSLTAAAATAPATLGDIVLGLAWYGHVRADLIAPVLLESYDPERKYSFVGWPEEFREAAATGDEEAAERGGRVLEVFGAERKFSFVGQPAAIEDNVAFAFAAWKLETAFLEEQATRPFLALATDTATGKAWEAIARHEADAVRRRKSQTPRSLSAGPGNTEALAGYAAALQTLDRPLVLPGFAALAGATSNQGGPATRVLRWAGKEATLKAGSIEELRSGLISLYAGTYRLEPGQQALAP